MADATTAVEPVVDAVPATVTLHCGYPDCPHTADSGTDSDGGFVTPDGWSVGSEQAWFCPEHSAAARGADEAPAAG